MRRRNKQAADRQNQYSDQRRPDSFAFMVAHSKQINRFPLKFETKKRDDPKGSPRKVRRKLLVGFAEAHEHGGGFRTGCARLGREGAAAVAGHQAGLNRPLHRGDRVIADRVRVSERGQVARAERTADRAPQHDG